MIYPEKKIEFYRQRSFSERLNATFDFIRANWKCLLKYTFYLIMPVCMLQSLAMNSQITAGYYTSLQADGDVSTATGFLSDTGLLALCALVGSMIIQSMVYAMMQAYAVREDGLRGIVLSDFKANLLVNLRKSFFIFMFVIAVAAVVCAASILSATSFGLYSLIIIVPLAVLFVLALMPLMILAPTYIFERDIRFSAAVGKAWKLGTKTLGGMIGLVVVLAIISYVIQLFTMMPWYLTAVLGRLFASASESQMTHSAGYKFILYILGLLQTYGTYAASTIGIIGLAFHYFHAREKVEGVTVEAKISNFNSL
jgi:hypothetical protein